MTSMSISQIMPAESASGLWMSARWRSYETEVFRRFDKTGGEAGLTLRRLSGRADKCATGSLTVARQIAAKASYRSTSEADNAATERGGSNSARE